MISESDLVSHYGAVVALNKDVFRCEDRFPRRVKYSYFALKPGRDLLLVSDDLIDDEFAKQTLASVSDRPLSGKLQLVTLEGNKYGFTYSAVAPGPYHGELKGRLDNKRDLLMLCVPCFRSEFSGVETSEEFRTLRTQVIPANNWIRTIYPKIRMRHFNSRTGSAAEEYVFSRFDAVIREVNDLREDERGFVELLNYKDQVMEIVSSRDGELQAMYERSDASQSRLTPEVIEGSLWRFLTD